MTEKKNVKWAVDLDSVVNTNEWSNDTDASFANLTHRYSQVRICLHSTRLFPNSFEKIIYHDC